MGESHSARHRKLTTLACIGMIAAMSGCALQAEYSAPAMNTPQRWSQAQGAKCTTECDQDSE
jgi:hypothetical protein